MSALVFYLLVVQGESPPTKTLADCRGKDFPVYEGVLKAKGERNLNAAGEDRIYRTKRDLAIVLTKRKGSKFVNQVTFSMPEHSRKTWKQILSDYGISPIGATILKMGVGRYAITPKPRLPADWAIEWNPAAEFGECDRLTIWQPIRVIYSRSHLNP